MAVWRVMAEALSAGVGPKHEELVVGGPASYVDKIIDGDKPYAEGGVK